MTDTEITQTLNVRMLQCKADAALVFGAGIMSGSIARRAANAFHNGEFEHIIVSGGVKIFGGNIVKTVQDTLMIAAALWPSRLSKIKTFQDFLSLQTEAEYMAAVLVKAGVPKEVISIEDKATNTEQNIKNSMGFISALGVQCLKLLTAAPMEYRAMGTARNNADLDKIDLVSEGVEALGLTWRNWDKSKDLFGKMIASLIRSEATKMDPNAAKTYIGKHAVVPNYMQEEERLLKRLRLAA